MKNYDVIPDVLVEKTPAGYLSSHDRQMAKAIELLPDPNEVAALSTYDTNYRTDTV